MDKDFWKALLRFLDDARDADLEERRERIREALKSLTSRGVRADARRMIRLIEEELLARCTLRRLRRERS